MGNLLCQIFNVYIIIIFARVILSWFPISPSSPMASIYSFLHTLTEPVLGTVRRIVPPVGMGGMGLDLSPLIVLIGLPLVARAVFGC